MGRSYGTATLLAALTAALVACGEPAGAGLDQVFLTLDPREASLRVGEEFQFAHSPASHGQAAAALQVRDSAVVGLTGPLRIKGLSTGETWVLLRTAGRQDSARVRVTPAEACPLAPRIEPQSATLLIGQSIEFAVQVCPGGPTDWVYSSSSAAVSVTPTGIATAVERGSAVITAASDSQPHLKAYAVITVP